MEFRILGPLEVAVDSRPVEIGGHRQRVLLAMLLLRANRVVSTDELIEGLWEDEPPETARKALQVHVSQLRKLMGSDRLVTKAPGYTLRVDSDELDLSRFQQLRTEGRPHEALALWRGPALADFAYDRFAQRERARLEELRLSCLEERIEEDLARGRDAELVGELETLVTEHPLRERLRRQLMLALYRSGRQAEALDAYRAVRTALVEELGIEPSAELRQLEQAILRQDPELGQAAARASSADDLPSGTVTFLFTDVEASTALLKDLDSEAYAELLEQHRALLRQAFADNQGVEVDTQGDSFLVAFARASDAVTAASAAQARLAESDLRVRMGLHTGEPLRTSEGYVGLVVHKAARIAAAGHGGQILLSEATRDLAEVEARDLGLHRLKDLDEPVRLYQLGEEEFPPLRSLAFTNLPVPATPFIGRETELEEVVGLLLRNDVHLVTLTGPGGTGKTRLALQAAAEASDRFLDGVTWVSLSPLRDPSLVLTAVAQSVGVSEGAETALVEKLRNTLATKRMLLLLDNAEHLLPAAANDIALLAMAGQPVVLVTSRERLQLQGEHLYSVPTLTGEDGVELFVARARALDHGFEADGEIGELCTRLENLPLALELAAARTSLFTPAQLLERISGRLDLLRGGRDADPRQQTLRATIQWSYDLLDAEEQRLLRRLSVFAGCTYDAAEEVCSATPDTLQSLIDKSLLRRRDTEFGPRYWMLETIREYAAERLEESGEDVVARLRHAEWCCELAERLVGMPPERRPDDEMGAFPQEYDNVRRALAWAWASGRNVLALRLGPQCWRFWMHRSLGREAVAWLERAAPVISDAPPRTRLEALRAAGAIAFWTLAETEQADSYWAQALDAAEELGEKEKIAWLERMRAGAAWERGDLVRALSLQEEHLRNARARGDAVLEANALHMLGEVLRDLERFDDGAAALEEADAIYRRHGLHRAAANNVHSLADLALDRGDLAKAAQLYTETLELEARHGAAEGERGLVYCLAGLASVLAERGRDTEAATVWGAVCAGEQNLGFRMIDAELRRYASRLAHLEGTPAWHEGCELTLEEANDFVAAVLEENP